MKRKKQRKYFCCWTRKVKDWKMLSQLSKSFFVHIWYSKILLPQQATTKMYGPSANFWERVQSFHDYGHEAHELKYSKLLAPRTKLHSASKTNIILPHLRFWQLFSLKLDWCSKEMCWKHFFWFLFIMILSTFTFNAVIMKFHFHFYKLQNRDLKWPHQIFTKNNFYKIAFKSVEVASKTFWVIYK